MVKSEKSSLVYDEMLRRVRVNGEWVIISSSRNTRPYYLMSIIAKDFSKIWNYDEIAEEMSQEYDKNSWKKFYQAAYSINEKVAKKTLIERFLIFDKNTVSVNPDYK